KLDLTDSSYTTYPFKFENIEDCCLYTMGMVQISEEELMIGTLSHGVLKFNITTGKFAHPKYPGKLNTATDILFNSVRDIQKDHTGRIWISSYYHGLAEYIPSKDSI